MNTDAMPGDVVLRPATAGDLGVLADVHLALRSAAGQAFPPGVHTPDEVRGWVAGWDLRTYDVWVAVSVDQVVGYARCTPTWLDDLYVPSRVRRAAASAAPCWTGSSPSGRTASGCGSSRPTARHATSTPATGSSSWSATNGVGQREEVARHQAGGRQVKSPYFRSMIDDVDLVLGDVLARRTALTRVVRGR